MNEKNIHIQHRGFELLSRFLNETPDMIDQKLIQELCQIINCSTEHAFNLLLGAVCGLDINKNKEDKILFNNFIELSTHQLKIQDYTKNDYYKNLHFPETSFHQWTFHYESYKPFEAFVCNDIVIQEDGFQIPQIGFFTESFAYPTVLENNRIWMTVTPNEIETMKQPVAEAFGHVLTFGLGLGYYAYMVTQKEDVKHLTIVEKDRNVIHLFRQYILPQFPHREKVQIIEDEAFNYAEAQMQTQNFDVVFTDLWHDVSDGLPLYLKMKSFEPENPHTHFYYWIEKSLKCYL